MKRFENTTKGEFYVDINVGCGSDTNCVCLRYDPDKVFLPMRKPKRYYTDYPKSSDGKGVILSVAAAERAGNYVATPEIKKEINEIEKENAEFISFCMNLNQKYDVTRLEECVRMLTNICTLTDSDIMKINKDHIVKLLDEIER